MYKVDKCKNKFSTKKDLNILDFDLLPNYINNNKDLLKNWMV